MPRSKISKSPCEESQLHYPRLRLIISQTRVKIWRCFQH